MDKNETASMEAADASIMSTPSDELILPVLVDDVIWEILNYLGLSDLLMMYIGGPTWRFMTSKLILKRLTSKRSKAKLMTSANATISSKDDELSLPIFNNDVVWEILGYLGSTELLMVYDEVPMWRSMTRKLLFKRLSTARVEAKYDPNANRSSWRKEDELSLNDLVCELLGYLCLKDLLIVHRGVPRWRYMTTKLILKKETITGGYSYLNSRQLAMFTREIPRKWLKNETLREWKQMLDVCSNLKQLNLFELHDLGVAQVARLLECIPRLCKHLKVLNLNYSPANIIPTEFCATVDMSEIQFRFPWIPLWGDTYGKIITLTSKLLEPQLKISDHVLEWIKRVLDKIYMYIRDPYWLTMTFQRLLVKDMIANTTIVVAQLQTVTLGVCESKTKTRQLLEQWNTLLSCNTKRTEFIVDDGFPKAIATACSILRQLEEMNNLSSVIMNLWQSLPTYHARIGCEPRWAVTTCKCCACWMHDTCQTYNHRCGYCRSKLAWYEWNTHWTAEYKPDWNYDWSKFEDQKQDNPEDYWKYKIPNDSDLARERDILNTFLLVN